MVYRISVLAHTSCKMERAKEVKDGVSSFLGSDTDRTETQLQSDPNAGPLNSISELTKQQNCKFQIQWIYSRMTGY